MRFFTLLFILFGVHACKRNDNEGTLIHLPVVAYVNGRNVNLRALPDTAGAKIARVQTGDSVYCRERSLTQYTIQCKDKVLIDYWYKVEDYRGHYAWIYGHYLLFNKIIQEPIRLPEPPVLYLPRSVRHAPEGWRKTADLWLDKAAGAFGDQPARWFIKVKAACDFETPEFRTRILQLVKKENAGEFNLGQVCDIFDYCVQWKYVNDPSTREYFSAASETIKANRSGDCDDFAIVMASGIMAIGGEARIVFVGINDMGAHAFAELNLGEVSDMSKILSYLSDRYNILSEDIHYRTDGKGSKWLNLDWFADKDYPGEEYYSYTRSITFYVLRDEYVTDLQN